MHRLPLQLAISVVLLAPALAHGQPRDSDGDGVPDSADAFPCDPTVSGVAFAPGEDSHGFILVEDQWPAAGDLDFNDLALAYHYTLRTDALGRAVDLTATFDVLAIGGIFRNGLGLHLPVPRSQVASVSRQLGGGPVEALAPSAQDPELTVRVLDDLRALFSGVPGPINSLASEPRRQGEVLRVVVTFSTPVALPVGGAPWDVFLFRTLDAGHELHRPEYAGTSAMRTTLFNTGDDASSPGRRFVDTTGIPFVLLLPAVTPFPAEGEAIDRLFPNIVTFAASGGTAATNFYASNVQGAFAYRDASGSAAPGPRAPTRAAADLSCVVVACTPGTGNCDGDVLNGCEADLNVSAQHCGACGVTCGSGQSCYSGVCQATCGGAAPPSFPPVSGCLNISPQGSASASSSWQANVPQLAADGNRCTGWNAGTFAPATWRIDFPSLRSVRGITLIPSISPNPANVHHAVDTSVDGVSWVQRLTISQSMSSGSSYSYDFGSSVALRALRVRSISSPSWIAWVDVALFACE